MATITNPFEFGRELTLRELVDREDELEELVGALTSARKYFLIGPRRYGKTSLLAAAAARASQTKATVLRYNAEHFPTLDQLASRIVADAASALSGSASKVAKAIATFFAALRPQLVFNPSDGTWTAQLSAATSNAPVPLLGDALDGLERVARTRKTPTALIIDEFQRIVKPGGIDAERQIRATIQKHSAVAYAFAGSETGLLAAMTGDADRPFYRLGTRRFLGPIPRPAFRKALEKGFTGVAKVTDDGVEAILDIAEDVPYNVQLLAHACWDECREHPRGLTLTRDVVERAQKEMASRNDPLYTQTWTNLTSPQQRALLAAVYDQDKGLTSGAVTRRFHLSPSTMQRAIEALTQRGILREELSQGSARLRLEDPLLTAWIKSTIPEPPAS